MTDTEIAVLAARGAGVISLCYDAPDTVAAYSAIDPSAFGYKLRDVVLADELGFTGVPVGVMSEDLATEEIVVDLRGTRVIANGPNEWEVDAECTLDPCPFVLGARTHRGFTTTFRTFRLLSGRPFPAVQLVRGHSLAAAWAMLLAAWWKASLISFAGPKVGDRAFSDYAAQAIPLLVRLVDDPDLVPKVPIWLWPDFEYLHAGPANEFDASKKINPALSLEDRLSAFHNIHTYWNGVDPTHPILPAFAV